ncbi:MAG: glycoside hydrolase family 32 protein [Lentisphaeria bacterium]|nr:glycoside hydrolase family 32 protein [Lentisphaeria bacterium]
MKLLIEATNLILPVRNGAAKVVLQLQRDGRMVREFNIELAERDPDWHAFYDVSEFRGETLELVAPAGLSPALEASLETSVQISDELPVGDNLYGETHRPQFHLTPRRGWNNDPNGMVHVDGTWHLFYQQNPFGLGWGNMHWGHWVSDDLAHWRERPTALFQKSLKDMAYSGGGMIDHGNTAGFGADGDSPLVVSFTSTGRGECLAYSLDGGETLVEHSENPVLAHKGRDPRIVRYEPQDKWVMVVYDELENGTPRYAFHESRDLKNWSCLSAIGNWYECPEFFELPLDGDESNRKWVLHGGLRRGTANGQHEIVRSVYMVGTFDGTTFTPETGRVPGHCGPSFYAAQRFSDAPDGRMIMMGWLQGTTYPGMPFSQGMTVPLELTLRSTADGPRLCFYPVRELDALRTESLLVDEPSNEEASALLAAWDAELLDLELTIEPADTPVRLSVRGLEITYDPASEELTCGNTRTRTPLEDGLLQLRLLVDRCVVELFASHGRTAFSLGGAVMRRPLDGLMLELQPAARVHTLKIAEMNAIWTL